MMNRQALIISALLLSLITYGETVKSKGSGDNRKAATLNALGAAVRQVNGLAVGEKNKLTNRVESFTEDLKKSLESSEEFESNVKSLSYGYISSYKVLKETKTAKGVDVELEVVVEKFDPAKPRPGVPRTIIVLPFDSKKEFSLLKKTYKGKDIADALQTMIITQLVKSRNFTVLDRNNLDKVLKEQKRKWSTHIADSELIKFGNMLGADLMVIGKIRSMTAKRKEVHKDLLGETDVYLYAGANIEYRMLNIWTGAIVKMELIDFKDQIDPAIMKKSATPFTDYILAIAAFEILNETLNRTNPIKVVKVSTSKSFKANGAKALTTIYLNQGKGRLSSGQQLVIFK